jgi:hypothetical protein
MSFSADQVPSENPFLAQPAPQPPADAAGEDAGGHPSSTEGTRSVEKEPPPAGLFGSSSRRHLVSRASSGPDTPAAAGTGKARGRDDSAPGSGNSSRRPSATALAPAASASAQRAPRRGLCGSFCACCSACTRCVGHSRTALSTYLLLLSVVLLGHFIYSCVLLGPQTAVGSACNGDNTCSVGVSSAGCLVLPVRSTCSDACWQPSVAPYLPFRYAQAGKGGGGYVQCPFPRINT